MGSVLALHRWRLLAAGMSIVLLTSAYYRIHSVSILSDAAGHFLASLTPEQRAKTIFPFHDQERFKWYYVPIDRKGLPLREMSAPQKHLAHALLAAGLSQRGYIKASTIMSLEDVLRILENDSGERRDPEKYYVSIFGEPSERSPWGFRFEGHHVSLHFTVVNGRVIATPSFFGANPADVRQGPRHGLRVLAREEDLARDLLAAFTPDQKKIAIVDPKAPADILTTNSRKAALEGQPSGLVAGRMTAKQRELFHALLAEYIGNFPEEIAAAREGQVQRAGDNLFFAWAGAEQRGAPHYYRIQSPTFLIEYDNTQNNANHIHSVWRDFNGDWGEDLLKEHYATGHRDAPR